MWISAFQVKGYRNVEANITLGRCNVLIGPNNSGKSNLLSALRFAADAAQSRAEDNFDRVDDADCRFVLLASPEIEAWFLEDRDRLTGCPTRHRPEGYANVA